MKENKIIIILLAVILGAGAVYLGILSWNAVRAHDYIGLSQEERHSITVSGEGKVIGVPDVAEISIGYTIEKKTVAAAQKDNTEKMNAFVKTLKADFAIDDKDLQTSGYSISPRYDWLEGKQVLRGYEVSQSLQLKIRDLDKISPVLDAAGQAGLNQIGSLAFAIDEPENIEQEAREKAIRAAKEKAEALAAVAGVKLGRIISFSESGNQPSPYYPKSYAAMDEAAGMGGAAPEIEAGSTEVVITATVEYEIL